MSDATTRIRRSADASDAVRDCHASIETARVIVARAESSAIRAAAHLESAADALARIGRFARSAGPPFREP